MVTQSMRWTRGERIGKGFNKRKKAKGSGPTTEAVDFQGLSLRNWITASLLFLSPFYIRFSSFSFWEYNKANKTFIFDMGAHNSLSLLVWKLSFHSFSSFLSFHFLLKQTKKNKGMENRIIDFTLRCTWWGNRTFQSNFLYIIV